MQPVSPGEFTFCIFRTSWYHESLATVNVDRELGVEMQNFMFFVLVLAVS